MPAPLAQRIVLAAHPSSPSEAIGGLEVDVRAGADGVLTLSYVLWGDMTRIRLPAAEAIATEDSRRADGLWKHTCFEAFLARAGSSEYCELNFSPAGQWAAYHFDSYRQGMRPLELGAAPRVSVRRARERLELDAHVRLLPADNTDHMKLALCAVVEEESGTLRYWAARHPTGNPDFHHPDGFILELTGCS
ncbi:MAG TPA: DOMON-like domain-containing protein [Steroidobacteraceae bacterium]|nr:DOMON-like domain-containing protein [Steroidobacteraceae bacterium]